MANTRNYTAINFIKEFAINELAPKYLNMDETNDLNIGLLGYTTELVGSVTEDSFNTISAYMSEMFPNLAVLPESIFNYAALFQLNTGLATAAQCDMLLFIPEDIILRYATKVRNSSDLYEFYLDSDMIISIENLRFKPDYNIKINYKRYRNDIIYTAMYDMVEYGGVFKNSISNVNNPYIKLKRINYERVKYIQLEVSTHQVDRFDMTDNIVDSTIINLPKYTIEFDDYLANFEVFYRAPDSNSFTQLEKRMLGTSPSKAPFCYYKTVDENRVEISFTSRDNFFHPEYNSEINISYFTTVGEEGNFLEYTGTSIVVSPSSETYTYNNNISMFALPISGAYNGTKPLSIEDLRNITIEKFSTVGSYTNENDLQLYFDNFNNTYNSNILFIKKRDDVFERLFSAFILLKDDVNEIYNTNTLSLNLKPSDFDTEQAQSNMYLLKPGHLFKYKPGILDTVDMIPDKMIADLDTVNEEFIFSNPFLIYYSKSPSGPSYYLNTIDNTYIVDYNWVNENSLVQFICNRLSIKRDGIFGSNKYTISLSITPTSELDNPMVIVSRDSAGNTTTTITNSIRVRLFATDNGVDMGYLNMTLSNYDLTNDIYTFSCELETDDYITVSNRFRVLNLLDIETGTVGGSHIIPMTDSVLRVEIGYKGIDMLPEDDYIITNDYNTKSHPVTFIKPLQMIRSTSDYIYNNDGVMDDNGYITGGTYTINIRSCPLIKAATFTTNDVAMKLFNTMITQYNHIENILSLITNNYAIDLKLYNTYGKSKNFYIGYDNSTLLNKVNISIKFKVHPVFGTNDAELIRDIKIFIKEYIENINDSGTNTFYVSNLIRSLENSFNEIEYLKFEGINNYPTDIQAIINLTTDLDSLTKQERIDYVPEYLTLTLDNVIIEIF